VVSERSTAAIDPEAVPRLKPDLSWEGLDLSPEEGFLLSRVDGANSIDALVKASGMEREAALGLFARLADRGILLLGADGAGPDGPAAAGEADDGVDPDALEPDIDLPLAAQKRILSLYARRDALNHYELLGIDRRADTKEVKRAYFRVSKEFHPDTYFRKNTGTFSSKINALFKLISTAYEVLSNEQKRAAYDKSLPYEPTPEEKAEAERKKQQARRDADLRTERRRRLLRRMPMAQRKAQARRHIEDARKHRETNNLVNAANSARLAQALDPDNPEVVELVEELGPKADAIRAENEYKRGRYEESMGNEEGALEAYLAAIELNPEEPRALHRAAAMMLALERDLKSALGFARQAVQIEPETADFVKVAAQLYLALDMHKNALREYNRYLQLNPFDERAQEKVKELRKKR
jgi:curved DNA-binding protein CbpA